MVESLTPSCQDEYHAADILMLRNQEYLYQRLIDKLRAAGYDNKTFDQELKRIQDQLGGKPFTDQV